MPLPAPCHSCRTLSDLPGKLRARRLHIEKAYGTVEFTTFWKWLFEMGMGIQALKVKQPSPDAVPTLGFPF